MSGAARLSKALEKAKALAESDQKLVASIVGACVADAAARPLHWVYDRSALKRYLAEGNCEERPEFLPQNRSPFYDLPTGENSCYFDLAFETLRALKANGGKYDHATLCIDLEERFFGSRSSDYDLQKRQDFMSKRAQAGGIVTPPMEGRWMPGALIEFHKAYTSGKRKAEQLGSPNEKATDGFCAALPVALLLASTRVAAESPAPGAADAEVRQVVATLSTYPAALSHGTAAARIVRSLAASGQFDYSEAAQGLPDVQKSLKAVRENLDVPHETAVGTLYGTPCYNPGSFQGAVHAFLTSQTFEEAVRKTIRAGGCNCSRSFFIGAMWGAKNGLDSIPVSWMERSTNAAEVVEMATSVFGTEP